MSRADGVNPSERKSLDALQKKKKNEYPFLIEENKVKKTKLIFFLKPKIKKIKLNCGDYYIKKIYSFLKTTEDQRKQDLAIKMRDIHPKQTKLMTKPRR